jgi:hypothetical protein
MATGTLVDVMKTLDIPIATFKVEYAKLSELDKQQLKEGVADGTMTYAVDDDQRALAIANAPGPVHF